MILCNVELHKALDEKRLIIDPEPQPRFPQVDNDHCPFDTHSVDLRLADEIVIPDPRDGIANIDLSGPGSVARFIKENSEAARITRDQPYRLTPRRFILGRTIERIGLPVSSECGTCLAARIEGKSSRARFGILIHFTAPTVHPGFEGTLTLEIINLGPFPFMLTPGMAIAQLIVEEVRGCPNPNPSQFQKQNTAAGMTGQSKT